MWTVLFAGLSHVNDGNQDAAGGDATLCRLKKVSLQVVTHRDEVPPGRLDLEFIFFEIGNNRVDLQAAFHSARPQNFDGRLGAVHGGDLPALFRKPECVSARSACEIERLARNEFRRRGHNQRRWRSVQIFRGAFPQAVAFIPIVNFHGSHRFPFVRRVDGFSSASVPPAPLLLCKFEIRQLCTGVTRKDC